MASFPVVFHALMSANTTSADNPLVRAQTLLVDWTTIDASERLSHDESFYR